MDESEGPDRVLQPRDADSNEGYLGYLSDVRSRVCRCVEPLRAGNPAR